MYIKLPNADAHPRAMIRFDMKLFSVGTLYTVTKACIVSEPSDKFHRVCLNPMPIFHEKKNSQSIPIQVGPVFQGKESVAVSKMATMNGKRIEKWDIKLKLLSL